MYKHQIAGCSEFKITVECLITYPPMTQGYPIKIGKDTPPNIAKLYHVVSDDTPLTLNLHTMQLASSYLLAVLLLRILKFLFILQLNISGCECTPTNCEQTTIAFQQLQRSTRRCFANFNYPINDVAKSILNDAGDLCKIIEQLHKENQKNSGRKFHLIPN